MNTSKKKLAPPDSPGNVRGRLRLLHVTIQRNARARFNELEAERADQIKELEKEKDEDKRTKALEDLKKTKSSTYKDLLHAEEKAFAKQIKDLEKRLKKVDKETPVSKKKEPVSRKKTSRKKRTSKKPTTVSSTAGSILGGTGGAMGRSEGLTQGAAEAHQEARAQDLKTKNPFKSLTTLLDEVEED
jgi:septal ring factor EnvC (AmiA/AmiB activator)